MLNWGVSRGLTRWGLVLDKHTRGAGEHTGIEAATARTHSYTNHTVLSFSTFTTKSCHWAFISSCLQAHLNPIQLQTFSRDNVLGLAVTLAPGTMNIFFAIKGRHTSCFRYRFLLRTVLMKVQGRQGRDPFFSYADNGKQKWAVGQGDISRKSWECPTIRNDRLY